MVRVSSILALTLGAGLSLAGFGGALAQVTRHPPRSVAPQGSARTFGSAAVYYPNCAAARAAGVAPIYRGQPGYRPELDRDGDGIACEPYRGH